jgi:hypothetical protein
MKGITISIGVLFSFLLATCDLSFSWDKDNDIPPPPPTEEGTKFLSDLYGKVICSFDQRKGDWMGVPTSLPDIRTLIIDWDHFTFADHRYFYRDILYHQDIGRLSWTPDGQHLIGPRYDNIVSIHVQNGNKDTLISCTFPIDSTSTALINNGFMLPDGETLLLVGAITQPSGDSAALFQYQLQTGDLKKIPLPVPVGHYARPHWSPDGQYLLFFYSGDLYKAKMDGSEHQIIFSGEGSLDDARWSPDGSKIVYVETHTIDPYYYYSYDIWVINSSGDANTRQCLTCGSDTELNRNPYPLWANDSRTILYLSKHNTLSIIQINEENQMQDNREVFRYEKALESLCAWYGEE